MRFWSKFRSEFNDSGTGDFVNYVMDVIFYGVLDCENNILTPPCQANRVWLENSEELHDRYKI